MHPLDEFEKRPLWWKTLPPPRPSIMSTLLGKQFVYIYVYLDPKYERITMLHAAARRHKFEAAATVSKKNKTISTAYDCDPSF